MSGDSSESAMEAEPDYSSIFVEGYPPNDGTETVDSPGSDDAPADGEQNGPAEIRPGQTTWDILEEENIFRRSETGYKPNRTHEHIARNPPVRRPDDREDSRSQFSMKTDPSANLTAAIIQTTGPEAEEPCSRCIKPKFGVWKACVRPPCEFSDKHVHGACANCAFRGRAADCSQSRKWKLADKSGMLSKAAASNTAKKWAEEADEIAADDDTPDAKSKLNSLANKMRDGRFDIDPAGGLDEQAAPSPAESTAGPRPCGCPK